MTPIDLARILDEVRTLAAFERGDLLDRVGGDEALLATIVAMFDEQGPAGVETLRSAIATRRGDDIRRAAHALKGMALTMSAPQLAALAGAIEDCGRENLVDEALALLHDVERSMARVLMATAASIVR